MGYHKVTDPCSHNFIAKYVGNQWLGNLCTKLYNMVVFNSRDRPVKLWLLQFCTNNNITCYTEKSILYKLLCIYPSYCSRGLLKSYTVKQNETTYDHL